ncbi:MAG: hypothetical protein VB857_12830, partial [Pirellulaceae bacterium]
MTGFAAGFTPNMLPGFCVGLVRLWRSGCGNCRNGPGLVVQADVGVPHRHADVTVPSQLTSLDQRSTVTQQLGDVGVPSHRVEVAVPSSVSYGMPARSISSLALREFAIGSAAV